jgi:hypothetical protein
MTDAFSVTWGASGTWLRPVQTGGVQRSER